MVMIVTEPAREKILELRAQEDDPDALGLRAEVTGVQGVEYTYDLTFDPVADADLEAGDVVEHEGPAGDHPRRQPRRAAGRHPGPADGGAQRARPPQPQSP